MLAKGSGRGVRLSPISTNPISGARRVTIEKFLPLWQEFRVIHFRQDFRRVDRNDAEAERDTGVPHLSAGISSREFSPSRRR
jgi:hypothetical protein